MSTEPILLKPAGKDYLWGGNRLKTEYNKHIELTPLAETWECSVHKDGVSVAASGEYAGMSLAEIVNLRPEYIGRKYIERALEDDTSAQPEQCSEGSNGQDSMPGQTAAEGNAMRPAKRSIDYAAFFPILVKFIDADKDLSIQVHPDDEYAHLHENQNGKTEMWYVIDARPGASLVCGFAHDVTPELLKKDVSSGQLMKHLKRVPVKKGDVFYIPAGTVHAIGAGIILAEIQESSNVTYRVWDYARTDRNGLRRETHFDKAVNVLNMKAGKDIRQRPRRTVYTPGAARELLCRCRYFETERMQLSMETSFDVDELSFQVLLCIEGQGRIESRDMDRQLSFQKGDCIFIPAGTGSCHVLGQTELLRIRC